MPRAIWSGTIGFGLVSVPVNLLTATRSRDVRFHQLEEGTGARIRYRRVSEASGEEVPNEQIVKGYEITPGQYVVVGEEEMQALAPKASRAIDILGFVELDEIDPVYFEQPYYLAPEGAAAKPYQLLVQAMSELRKVAIGRLVLRSKEHLVAIRPVDGILCLETMRHADEVLAPASVVGEHEVAQPTEREVAMAKQLIEALAEEFRPEQYHDEYREHLLELIERKAAGEEIVAQPLVEDRGKVLDLMAALEASLARSDPGTSGASASRKGAGEQPTATADQDLEEASAGDAAKPRKRARRSRQSA